MNHIIKYMRSNMSATDWQSYCEDFITGCIALIFVLILFGVFG